LSGLQVITIHNSVLLYIDKYRGAEQAMVC